MPYGKWSFFAGLARIVARRRLQPSPGCHDLEHHVSNFLTPLVAQASAILANGGDSQQHLPSAPGPSSATFQTGLARCSDPCLQRIIRDIRLVVPPYPWLLPAPSAVCGTTLALSPLRLRHQFASGWRRSEGRSDSRRSHASEAAAGVAAEAAARHSTQLADLRRLAGVGDKVCSGCDERLELYLFPVKRASGGRGTMCYSCKAALARKRHPHKQYDPSPTAADRQCSRCGEQRKSRWFRGGTGSTGLDNRCMPCQSLGDLRMREKRGEKRQREGHLWREPLNPEKACLSCMASFPVENFYAGQNTKDGISSNCRKCVVKRARALHKDRMKLFGGHPPVAAVPDGDRTCSKCQQTVPRSKFYIKSGVLDGITNICKDCVLASQARLRKIRSHSHAAP